MSEEGDEGASAREGVFSIDFLLKQIRGSPLVVAADEVIGVVH